MLRNRVAVIKRNHEVTNDSSEVEIPKDASEVDDYIEDYDYEKWTMKVRLRVAWKARFDISWQFSVEHALSCCWIKKSVSKLTVNLDSIQTAIAFGLTKSLVFGSELQCFPLVWFSSTLSCKTYLRQLQTTIKSGPQIVCVFCFYLSFIHLTWICDPKRRILQHGWSYERVKHWLWILFRRLCLFHC